MKYKPDIAAHAAPLAGAVFALAAVCAGPAAASSHREAPFITTQPKVDGTDFYLFRSYEPGRDGYLTLIANYLPLQDAYGGPNYFSLDRNALYEIHIDNDGDAREDISFQFSFKNTLKDIALDIGGQKVSIPLIQAGAIDTVNPGTLNLRETYTVDVVRSGRRSHDRASVTNLSGGGREFDKPVDNIGEKTFGGANNYEAYAAKHIYDVRIPGCSGQSRLFVGQRKDPFAVNLGKVFDLINLNPLGAPDADPSTIDDKNVTSLMLEVPIACLTKGDEKVIGGWTTAILRQGQLLSAHPPSGHQTTNFVGGPWVQVSRLGMPLVNEVVIGLKDKDRFNGAKPKDDGQFATYVTNPTLPALIELLFKVPAPTHFPRTDLVAAFLTGVAGVNQPANVVPSEMLRLNTSLPVTPKATQQNLGVLAGDVGGFPNGRRPGDDVVDIELRVAMGVLCHATGPKDDLKVGCRKEDAPVGDAPITDQVRQHADQFGGSFPYLRPPLPGSP